MLNQTQKASLVTVLLLAGFYPPFAFAELEPEPGEELADLEQKQPPNDDAALSGGPAAAASVELQPKAEEAKTGILKYVPGAYASLEIRHSTLRVMDRDAGPYRLSTVRLLESQHVLQDNTKIYLRPTIGSTFFDGRVDTSFTYVMGDQVGTHKVTKVDFFNSSQWNIIDGKFNADSPYSFGPSAFTDFFNGPGRNPALVYSDLGVTGEATYQFAIPSGALAIRGYANPNVELYSAEQRRKNQAPLVHENARPGEVATNLQPVAPAAPAEPATTTEQKDPFYLAYYGILVTYKPAAWPNFSLGLGADVVEVWKPIYKETVREGQSSPSVVFSHYDADATSFARLTLKYKFNDKISLINQTRHYYGGIFQRPITNSAPETTNQVGNISWENRLSLVVTVL